LSGTGLDVADTTIQALQPAFIKTMDEFIRQQDEWAKVIRENPLDQAKVRETRLKMDAAAKAMQEAIEAQTALNSKDLFVQAAVKFSKSGVSVSKDAFNRMKEVTRATVVQLSDRIIELQQAIDSGLLNESARISAQTEIDANAEKITELAKNPVDRAKAAGEDFTGKMRDAFSDGMFQFIRKGKFNILGLATTFVDNIVKNFTDSLSQSIFKKGSLLGGVTNTIGAGSVVSEGGGGLFGGITKIFGKGKKSAGGQLASQVVDAAPKAGAGITSAIAEGAPAIGVDIGTEISKTVGGAAGGVGGGLMGLAGVGGSLFGMLLGGLFSEGGAVSGPGTSTSDSIPARLSNGEFVIKAKQVKKYRPLVNAINDDNLPKFAEGGLVGNIDAVSVATASNISPVNVTNDNSKAVVNNIQITGDISRQTKREVYGMIPQIAAGVNAYNREKGIR